MMKKITLFALLAILFGCAFAQEQVAASISLSVYPSSSQWWIAVDPLGDGNATVAVDLQENGGDWAGMAGNPSWGYWQLAATHGNGFNLPLSFRLTAASGEQLVISNALSTIAGETINTAEQFNPNYNGHQPVTQAPTKKATPAPTKKPTPAPTSAPTKKATPAPTKKPTHEPTSAPTKAATAAPTAAPTKAPTAAPTKAATAAPTKAPTPAPTTKPTKAPTAAPTPKAPSTGSSGNTDLCAVTSTASEPLKILVPLYVDPGKEWDELITAAATGVPIIAIINPDDGPVASGPDSSYKTYMQKFANAGIQMVGYVHTLYGDRAISEVEADVTTYATKYPGLIGIFVDEASSDASEVSYYTSLFNNIKSHAGYVNTIINPGQMPDQGYMNAATNIMIYENPGTSWKNANLASWVSCAPNAAAKAGYKYKFSGIAYNAAQSTMPTLLSNMANAGIGMVYVTDGATGCCTYNDLTTYFAPLAAAVNALN